VIVVQPGDVATEFTQNRAVIKNHGVVSDYSNHFKRAFWRIQQDERFGIRAEHVAYKIEYSLRSSLPRFRYIPSSTTQRLAVIFKKIIPFSIFKNVVRRHYDIV
jgi:short-subunit dehydrogenase